MKANKLLERYKHGERDFQESSLQGTSFKSLKNLSGADFSKSHLQGADFTDVNLTGANFSGCDSHGVAFTRANLTRANFIHAKAGVPKRWVFPLLIGATVMLTLSSFPFAITGWWLTYFLFVLPEEIKQHSISSALSYLPSALPATFLLAVLIIFFYLILNKAIEVALVGLAGVGTVTVAGTAFLAALVGAANVAVAIAIAVATAAVGIGFAALAGAGAIVGANTIGASAIVETNIIWKKFRSTTTFLITFFVIITSLIVTYQISSLAAAAVAATGAAETAVAMKNAGAGGIAEVMAGLGGIVSVLLSTTVSWFSLRERKNHSQEKYMRVWKIANTLITGGFELRDWQINAWGTSFRNATLIEADFTKANLKSTDLRGAILKHTRWEDVKKLEYSRLGRSYLQNPKVYRLLISNYGVGQKFDRLDLSGLNLKGAKLQNSSFERTILRGSILDDADLSKANLTGANLIKATLKHTDLYGAQLVRTQLGEADLTDSSLTHACIEDWNITIKTELKDIRCEYIFMSSSDSNNRRQPPTGNFENNEFSEFIIPMVQTLNLYHNEIEVIPEALAVAYNELRLNNPEAELEIASIERRGKSKNKLLIKVFTSEQADHSKLHSEYTSRYSELRYISANKLRFLLVKSEQEIRRLEKENDILINRPIKIFKEFSMDNSIKIQGNSNVNIDNIATGSSVINSGEVGGDVNTEIGQFSDSGDQEEFEIQELLSLLRDAIEEESELEDEDKAMALEQVQALAKAMNSDKEKEEMKVEAKKASRILRGIVTELPNAAKLADACSKLLPMILALFGL